MVPQDLLYTDQHEWIRVEGNVGTVGVTEYAQESLGDITFVELPDSGRDFGKGEEVCAIESAKAASGIYAPVSGKVVGANDALDEDPGLVNSDCYGKGWIYKIELEDSGELDQLIQPGDYQKLLNEAD